MALYGGLAENTRRNERVERGLISVPAAGTATIGFTSTQTVNISPPAGGLGGMRQMTHFELAIDDQGLVAGSLTGIVGTSAATVTGSFNAAGTILTIRCWSFTSTANPTLIATTTNPTLVRYTIYGNLVAAVADVTKVNSAQTIGSFF